MLTTFELSRLIDTLPACLVGRVFADLAPLLSDLAVMPVEIVGGGA